MVINPATKVHVYTSMLSLIRKVVNRGMCTSGRGIERED